MDGVRGLKALFNVWLMLYASPRLPHLHQLSTKLNRQPDDMRSEQPRKAPMAPSSVGNRLSDGSISKKKSHSRRKRHEKKDPRVGSSPPSWHLGVDVLPWPWSVFGLGPGFLLLSSSTLAEALSRRFLRHTPPLSLSGPPSTPRPPPARPQLSSSRMASRSSV